MQTMLERIDADSSINQWHSKRKRLRKYPHIVCNQESNKNSECLIHVHILLCTMHTLWLCSVDVFQTVPLYDSKERKQQQQQQQQNVDDAEQKKIVPHTSLFNNEMNMKLWYFILTAKQRKSQRIGLRICSGYINSMLALWQTQWQIMRI